jgi:hypothetical protein
MAWEILYGIAGDKTPPGPPFFMFLLYIDASGTPELTDPHSNLLGG